MKEYEVALRMIGSLNCECVDKGLDKHRTDCPVGIAQKALGIE